MKSKKGVIITVGILIAITIASFSVWIVNNPTNTEMTIVVTDFENHQEGISERHKIVSNAIEESFSELMNGVISPEEYIKVAEISSSQNTALILNTPFCIFHSFGTQQLTTKRYFSDNEISSIYSPLHHFKDKTFQKKNVILLIGTGSVQFSAKRYEASFTMQKIHDCDYYST